MMKKTFILKMTLTVTCLILFCSQIALAADELTLKEALSKINENKNLVIARLVLEKKRDEVSRLIKSGDLKLLETAQEEVSLLAEKYNDDCYKLKQDLLTTYFNTLEKELWVRQLKNREEQAHLDLIVENRKYAASTISALNLKKTENTYLDIQHNLAQGLIDLETSQLKLKQLLNLPLNDKPLQLKEESIVFAGPNLSLLQWSELGLENDKNLIALNKDLKEIEKVLDNKSSPLLSEVDIEELVLKRELILIGIQQKEETSYLNVRLFYYHLLDQAYRLESGKRDLELSHINLEAQEVRHRSGILGQNEIVKERQRCLDAERDYQGRLINYSLAWLEFLEMIGQRELFWGEFYEN